MSNDRWPDSSNCCAYVVDIQHTYVASWAMVKLPSCAYVVDIQHTYERRSNFAVLTAQQKPAI